MKLRKRARWLKRTQKCWIVVQAHGQWGVVEEWCVPGSVRPFVGPIRPIDWDAFYRAVVDPIQALERGLVEAARALVSGVEVDVDAALDLEDE
jgi:hypothetical protein